VRIVLSGHSDVEQIHRSIRNAHQYLSKPCSSDVLRRVITRACALRDVLDDQGLRRTLSRMTTLPSPPAVYRDLLQELEVPDASLVRIAGVISGDIAMTTRVLRLVNSAWFALNRTIIDAHDAVLMLGTETIKTLVLSAHVFAELARESDTKLLAEIGEHSLQVAQLARRIAFAEQVDVTVAGHAFTAGMMHEVGLMVLAVNDIDGIEECLRLVADERLTMADAERRVWNATHAQVGAYLLGLWGMPTAILEAVAFCGAPTADGCVGLGRGGFTPLTAIHVADALVHERLDLRVPSQPVDRSYLSRIGLRSRLDVWGGLLAGGPSGDSTP
jgi:HD-like signal output (HDOD) protein